MDDTEFLHAFEHGALPDFPHQSHLRMAWLYLRAGTWEDGMARICAGIRRLDAHHGGRKYHETITQFWARMVSQAIVQSPDAADFAAFIAQHPELLDGKLITQFYSPDLLHSEQARREWVKPDLRPF